MRLVSSVAALLFSVNAACASEIREFSVSTLERLGNDLYRQEMRTERGAELVLETHPVARSLKLNGWITELRKDGDINYMIAESSSGPVLAYTITFHGSAKPEIQDERGQPLPPNIAVRYKANQTAAKVLKSRLYKLGYNFEVLDDPDGSGFLVYAVGVTSKPEEVVLAGHFRVTVSADGEKAERIDPLSESLMIVNKNENHSPRGYHDVAVYFNQIVSNKPVETLVYAGKLLQKDVFVGTPDHKMWVIHNGKMTIDNSKPDNKTAAGAARRAFRH